MYRKNLLLAVKQTLESLTHSGHVHHKTWNIHDFMAGWPGIVAAINSWNLCGILQCSSTMQLHHVMILHLTLWLFISLGQFASSWNGTWLFHHVDRNIIGIAILHHTSRPLSALSYLHQWLKAAAAEGGRYKKILQQQVSTRPWRALKDTLPGYPWVGRKERKIILIPRCNDTAQY